MSDAEIHERKEENLAELKPAWPTEKCNGFKMSAQSQRVKWRIEILWWKWESISFSLNLSFCGDGDTFEILSELRILSNLLISKFDF